MPMQKTGLNELREKYLSFFEQKGHLRLPSFSLVPRNDPSLLLINSGMAPLKPYFTGAVKPPSKRVTTCQKCIRTPDIENVGKTSRHGTFFEMLGNFSFGDYFKKEAIPWAWELVTKVLEMPEEKLWVTIYQDDDEAYDIWKNTAGISEDRIVRLGKEDNFWEHGTGPCGPCSEIHYDRGLAKGCGKPDCRPGCNCDRFVEFWNLVFTQYDKDENGNYNRLPNPNIDTGLGLERLACIMQGVNNLFEVDTVNRILELVCEISGKIYGSNERDDISVRVITDHIRSTVMMISDGIIPSNEGRGYVLRRLLRRASRHGRLLGIDDPFMCRMAKAVINESKAAYPELEERAGFIDKVIKVEEERFAQTVDQGLSLLNDLMAGAKKEGAKVLKGETVFKLHDTYGFPLDLTREIAAENGLETDTEGFQVEMDIQRSKAREALKSKASSAWGNSLPDVLKDEPATIFEGYDSSTCKATLKYMLKDGELAEYAAEGEKVTIISERTVFYAEGGGQAGDTGYITGDGFTVKISDTKKSGDGKYLHTGVVEKGAVIRGAEAVFAYDAAGRAATARNHTATHLLHKALRKTLGDHVAQAGSYVDSQRLRFDFNHFSPMTPGEIADVEKEVNLRIFDALNVQTSVMTLEEAKKSGAVALFDEKYHDNVRVVKAGDYSAELCAGTHIDNTSKAGLFKILGETGVAAGIRRIEAVTGTNAVAYYEERENLLGRAAEIMRCSPDDIAAKAESLYGEMKHLRKEIEECRQTMAGGSLQELLEKGVVVNGVKIISGRIDKLSPESMRNTADKLRDKTGDKTGDGSVSYASGNSNKTGDGSVSYASGNSNKTGDGSVSYASGEISSSSSGACLVILGGEHENKAIFVAAATKEAVKAGIHAGNIVREAAKAAGGGGGGRPDMAQAGGRDVAGIDKALIAAFEEARKQLGA